MAQYEFECQKCHHIFTVQQSFAEHEKHPEARCPQCGSTQVERHYGGVYAHTAKKS